MTGIRGTLKGALTKPNRKMDDKCVGTFTVTSVITFPLIVPKWLKIKGDFSAESNYVLIAPVTDTELKAVEVTDARNGNADTTLPFVTKQLKQPMDNFSSQMTRAHRVKSFILLFWSRSMDLSVVHSSTQGWVVPIRHPLFWIILAFDQFIKNSSA